MLEVDEASEGSSVAAKMQKDTYSRHKEMAQMMQFEMEHQESEERHSDYDADEHNG